MLAEAVHSLADTGNQALLLGAIAILLGCKVEFDTRLTFEQLTNAIDAAESRVRAAVPAVGLIYMEPDLCEPADGARPA